MTVNRSTSPDDDTAGPEAPTSDAPEPLDHADSPERAAAVPVPATDTGTDVPEALGGTPGAVPSSAHAASGAQTPDPDARTEDELRESLGLEPLGTRLPAAARRNGWIVTGVVGLIAALTRLVGLGHPSTLMFDEIYYAKDAYSLWHNGYETQWSEGSDALFAQGDVSGMLTSAARVVHPQLGKWLIGIGEWMFGPGSAFGWRFMPAVAGILTVLLLTRLTLRLTRSPFLAGLAGFLLAIDGVGITESRIALLDVFIGLFATVSIYCLVRDREWSRARLARDLAGTAPGHLAPKGHWRPWLLAAGVSLGLTTSIKWSGLYLLVAVGLLVVVWDTLALRRVRARAWFLEGVIARGVGDFLRLVPVALGVYVASWWSWFLHDGAYQHGWAATQRLANGTVARGWMPDWLNDFIQYHIETYQFHVTLDSTHPYMSHPIGWLLQWRPTSFYWPSEEEMGSVTCGSGRCIQAITSIGNIPIWWAALVALVFGIAVLAVRKRDWRVWVALIGYIGLYLPWFMYPDRTIFTFYTVAFVPFAVLVLVLALGSISGTLLPVPGSQEARREAALLEAGEIGPGLVHPRGSLAAYLGFGTTPSTLRWPRSWTGVPRWRLHWEGLVAIGILVIAAVVFAAAWWPIWTGRTVSYDFWHWHMWFSNWI